MVQLITDRKITFHSQLFRANTGVKTGVNTGVKTGANTVVKTGVNKGVKTGVKRGANTKMKAEVKRHFENKGAEDMVERRNWQKGERKTMAEMGNDV